MIDVGHFARLSRGAKEHWDDGDGKIVFAIAAGWFLSIGVRLTYPVLLPYLRTAYGLTLTTAGLLLTVLWVAYALGQLPSGLLADRIGAGTVMVVSTLIAAVTLALVVGGDTAPVLFGATALFGFGTALYAVGRYAVLSDVYPEQLGTAVGVTSAAGDVGNTLLPPIAGFLTAVLAWQVGFGFAIPIFLLAGVGLWMTVPRRTSAAANSEGGFSRGGLRRLLAELRRPSLVLVTAVQAFGTSIWQVFTGFYPTYLIEVKGLPAGVASGLFALFFALGILIKPLSGRAYDRFGARRSLLVVVGLSGVGLLVVPYADRLWQLVGVTVLASPMLGRGTISLSYMTDALPDEIQNTGFGILRTGYLLVGASSPVVFGAVADRGFFDEVFLLLAAVAAVTLLLASQLPDR